MLHNYLGKAISCNATTGVEIETFQLLLTIINVLLTEGSLFYGGTLLHVYVLFALCKLETDWLVMVESKVFISGLCY